MNNARPLRTALLTNAFFSTTCAMIMLLYPLWLGELLGFQAPLLLQVIAVGLLFFAADLLHQATRSRMLSWRALISSTADFLWVVCSFLGVFLFADYLAESGLVLVLSVAAVVLLLGIWQLWSINYFHLNAGSGLHRHCITVKVNAPANALWQVISKIGDINKYMPSLKSAEMLDGKNPGRGAIRRCVDQQGKAWSEECTEFTNQSFTVRFLADAPDFPFPATNMVGGWSVSSVAAGSEVMVWWELSPKPRYLAPILLPILAFQADRDFPQIIARMAQEAMLPGSERVSQPNLLPAVALVPRWC